MTPQADPAAENNPLGEQPDSIVVCLKWVATRPEIDPLTGAVTKDDRFSGLSPADRAALEWALRVGEAQNLPIHAVSVGPNGADAVLQEAISHGATSGIRLETTRSAAMDSRWVAGALSTACETAVLVLCGDYSLDRGSGSVPAFLAHELGYGQALGCVGLEIVGPNTDGPGLIAERRLDQGRRERLQIEGPTVLSFEGGLELRRAGLGATMTSPDAAIDVRRVDVPDSDSGTTVVSSGPYRPRPRVLAGPQGSTIERVRQLTGVGEERPSAKQLELPPDEAAETVIEQLRAWGYIQTER